MNQLVDFSYNLWHEPWLDVETISGDIKRINLEKLLLECQFYRAIYHSSPLVTMGLYRLVVAILQDIYRPEKLIDIVNIKKNDKFPPEKIIEFGQNFGDRFDLFSKDAPFMQSADLPLTAKNETKLKPVSSLLPEIPSGTEVVHFRHTSEKTEIFCSRCTAFGLIMIPAFATSGGKGIRPSINGTPPFYVIPGGNSLFEILAHSLLIPEYQNPFTINIKEDKAFWRRKKPVTIMQDEPQFEVGYLHSLTFPTRRVRLHPVYQEGTCTACGDPIKIGVKTIVFEMGECRPKDAPFWQDPFVAYQKKKDKAPVPIRPKEGIVIWREYVALFLGTGKQNEDSTKIRPRIMDQLSRLMDEINETSSDSIILRVIGMRTNMNAKIFEWIDAGFEVPSQLFKDQEGRAAYYVNLALGFAEDCEANIKSIFCGNDVFGYNFKSTRQEMLSTYWESLGVPFKNFLLKMNNHNAPADDLSDWKKNVFQLALAAFQKATETLGDDANILHRRFTGEKNCIKSLSQLIKGKKLKKRSKT